MTDPKRFLLRLPEALHRGLKGYADFRSQSLNQACVDLMTEGLAQAKNPTPDHELLDHLQSLYAPEGLLAIILFGSVARGTETAESDYDLLLVFEASVEMNRALYRKFENAREYPAIARKIGRTINIQCVALPKDPTEVGSLWREVALDGKVLWGKNPSAIAQFLAEIRDYLLSGEVTRKTINGQPYWVRKQRKVAE